MRPFYGTANLPDRLAQEFAEHDTQMQRLLHCSNAHTQKIFSNHAERTARRWRESWAVQQRLSQSSPGSSLAQDLVQYVTDATQRVVLTADVLRERANNDARHQAAGTPPVLNYDYELVLDARTFARPANYQLLKICCPTGSTQNVKRPYMIIDPRAGHGAGIGGFKPESQVGVALQENHPVYFVVFNQHPVPGQTLADVTAAEAEFVREIARRHPASPKPVVIGNCQGGWATLVLAAANPDITGPLVLNGSPVSTWSGEVGANPMRYSGGLMGGLAPALLSMDLNHGEFDGAHLVSNFEQLNPGRNYFGKYYDLYDNVDAARKSFLEFERWWGGYHFLNESEMRWIVEQIFIGNKLARGEAELEPGRPLDLKAIRAPIVVFASKGDNITPPQQALNWIVDTYADENEIRIRGQRIVYMVHDKVGHLGIFVSSSIARKEHTEVTSTLKTIEALPPGLYEMTIDRCEGTGCTQQFMVSFHDRKLSDILAVAPNDRELERGFGAVSRMSRLGADLYEATARPLVQAVATTPVTQLLRDAHPSRISRRMFADDNPAMASVAALAAQARAYRQPAAVDNPWRSLERTVADGIAQSLDLWRDLRDYAVEMSFIAFYGAPWMNWYGQPMAQPRKLPKPEELRWLPSVQSTLTSMDTGGYPEAVVRMLVLLAGARRSVRRDRLERSALVMTHEPPFDTLTPQRRSELIHEQAIIVEFEREKALQQLPLLLPQASQRRRALEVVRHVIGEPSEMEPPTEQLLARLTQLLAVSPEPASDDVSLRSHAVEASQAPEVHAGAARVTPPHPQADARKTTRKKPTT